MHRATPANSSFRAYSSGGARALLQKFGEALPVDDAKQMQEVAASFMKGEVRKGIEHAQQYGITSVPFDPDPEKDGKPGNGPETFVNFIGGNRSFPVAGPIDDRRHRLKGLKPGDVALYRGKDDGIQLTLTALGTVLSHFPDKKFRTQIVGKAAQAAGGAKDDMGQKSILENASSQFFEMTSDGTTSANKTITDIAETALTSAVKNGAISQVAKSFTIGAPSANLRAGDTPKPEEPTEFNIIGSASASVGMSAPTAPPGTSSTQLATTAFVGAALFPLIEQLRAQQATIDRLEARLARRR